MNNWSRTILTLFALYLFVACKEKVSTKKIKHPEYSLQLDRGAFHYDTFILTLNDITFTPQNIDNFTEDKYKKASKVKLNKEKTLAFFRELEAKGIWDLKDSYAEESSCTSQLKITISNNEKTKTIICDDYQRGCNKLITYIEQQMIAFEGNNLKRIYLPG